MRKRLLLITIIMVIFITAIGGTSIYIVNTPEYALTKIKKSINDSGIDGLMPFLTANAKERMETLINITENRFFDLITSLLHQNEYVCILKSEIKKVRLNIEDILKSKDTAIVIISFNYEDILIGNIEIYMLKDEGWKIDELGFPQIDKLNW